MSNTDDRDLSLLIFSTLNNFGFKKENVCFRSLIGSYEDKAKETSSKEQKISRHHIILVGSAGEGVQLSDSDVDGMGFFEDIICLDQGDTVENLIILEADHSNTAPGYTKVVLTDTLLTASDVIYLHLMVSMCTSGSATSTDRHSYVSSTKFRSFYFNIFKIATHTENTGVENELTTNGPAVTFRMSHRPNSEGDAVPSLLFYGSEHLRKWANRTRHYTWPSSECVREISGMEGYLVPVGDKLSIQQDLEWRICYTTAEKELIASLNDIQIKVYVLLKLLAKSVLKPVCKALTSYVVKNIVFWIMEGTHQQSLSPDLIVNLIQKSLYFMKYCLENNHFPNYMIPERNLLRGAVNSREKQNVINFLSDCLREGGTVLLRVPKLYQCVFYSKTYPENVIKFGKWRDEVEKLDLQFPEICDNFFINLYTGNMSMNEIQNFTSNVSKMLALVMPDLIPLLNSGKNFQEVLDVYAKRLKMIHLL
ncbi:uncharacterized protein LOC128558798 [Mercenaria mercenaria]|uniref:uncharacterized protein LOC128558798 n=1 Tax=Mercenaria mercenaria TaxID=6596 RepID=UPI00234EA933|nr:uncharacterized protein LOC128558798 [Mercenaria mercenaria]